MRATITTTPAQLVTAYGERQVPGTPGLTYSSFGPGGVLTPDLATVLGVERCGSNYWLVTPTSRRQVGAAELLRLLD